MTARSHEIVGIAATEAVCLLTAQKPTYALIACTGALAGALLPDFDTPNSRIGRKLPLLFFPVWLFHAIISVLSYLPGPLQKGLNNYSKATGHRGFSHYPITWFIIFAILLPVAKNADAGMTFWMPLLIGMGIGIVSHIVADMFFGGVPLLYPFHKARITLSPFKTSGIAEKIVSLVFLIMLIPMTLELFIHNGL